MSDTRRLHIVNENDEIIGEETREKIHQEGLLHRGMSLWFVTPQKEIIFQHRAKDKDAYPDLLDATVSGHVEIGDDYVTTAVKEAKEEAGIDIDPDKLIVLKKMKQEMTDQKTGSISNTIRMQYGYIYEGDINDLQPEVGKIIGFEAWSIDTILNATEEQKRRFVPIIFEKEYLDLFYLLTSTESLIRTPFNAQSS